MEEVVDLHQARRLIAQLRSEKHQLQIKLDDAQEATNRWRGNYFHLQARERELEAALAKTSKS